MKHLLLAAAILLAAIPGVRASQLLQGELPGNVQYSVAALSGPPGSNQVPLVANGCWSATDAAVEPCSSVVPLPVAIVSGGSSGGGGGGAVTAASGSYVDGALVTLGTEADSAYTGSGSATDTAIFKGIYALLATTQAVTVSNFPATQPVSVSALPLPAGAATSANQPAINADGGALTHVTNFPTTQPVQGVAGGVPVTSVPTDTQAQASASVTAAGAFDQVSTVGYGSVAVSVSSVGTGNSIVAQESLDGTNWFQVQSAQNGGGITAASILSFPVEGLSFRLNLLAYGSGTVSAAVQARAAVPGAMALSYSSQQIGYLGAGTNTIGNVGVTQGSTTSGQYGPMIQAAVGSAPSYTAGTTQPLVQTTGGALRIISQASNGNNLAVATGSATSGVSQLAGCNNTTSSPSETTGNQYPLYCDAQGSVRDVPTPSADPLDGLAPYVAGGSSVASKASAGNVYEMRMLQGSTAGYLVEYNGTSVPTGALTLANTIDCIPAAANAYVNVVRQIPDQLGTGVAIFDSASCTTAATLVTPVLLVAKYK